MRSTGFEPPRFRGPFKLVLRDGGGDSRPGVGAGSSVVSMISLAVDGALMPSNWHGAFAGLRPVIDPDHRRWVGSMGCEVALSQNLRQVARKQEKRVASESEPRR